MHRCEDEARRQAELVARQKAEEEARLKAEEVARVKAAEEARLQAELQARLQADEAARLQAEQAQRAAVSMPDSGPFASIPSPSNPAAPGRSVLREWEDTHERKLEESASKESNEKRARQEAGLAELTKFHEERLATIQSRHAQLVAEQRAREATASAATSASVTSWELVAELIGGGAQTAGEDSRDTSRMRSLLLQLKNSGKGGV